MYGLCDCNNFFASCERVFNPAVRAKPVVVLSSNDGCVIARSNEAKALGIKMGQPFFQIKELVEKSGVVIFSTNFVLYGDMSRRVMHLLETYVPALEVYSIDEAFMDFRGVDIDKLRDLGVQIARDVKRQTGIPVSIGIAPTKTLAKIASKLCKQYPRLEGCCVMNRRGDIEKVLRKFDIGDVWGVGRKYGKKLRDFGVMTAWDFTQMSPEWVRGQLSVVGLRTWNELRGEACLEFENSPTDRQTICVSRSFTSEVADFDELSQSVSYFAGKCCEKLRRQRSVCGQVLVFIYTNSFKADMPQAYESRVVRLAVSTDSTIEITQAAMKLLSEVFKSGYGYKKAGVILSDISTSVGIQTNMFDSVDRGKHARLMQAMDKINGAEGRDKIVLAAQGLEGVKFSRNFLSPNYTTDWNDIITVKI